MEGDRYLVTVKRKVICLVGLCLVICCAIGFAQYAEYNRRIEYMQKRERIFMNYSIAIAELQDAADQMADGESSAETIREYFKSETYNDIVQRVKQSKADLLALNKEYHANVPDLKTYNYGIALLNEYHDAILNPEKQKSEMWDILKVLSLSLGTPKENAKTIAGRIDNKDFYRKLDLSNTSLIQWNVVSD